MKPARPTTPWPGLVPIFGALPLSRTVAWSGAQPISAATLLAEASALAARMPESGQIVNLCQDRYLFAVGMVAALLRGQMSLMPPNALPSTLRQLPRPGGALMALVDDPAIDCGGLSPLLLARQAGLPAPAQEPLLASEVQAVCLLTSGSTGQALPHVKRWGPLQDNIAAQAECLAQHLSLPSIVGLNLVATVPPQHSYGFESSILLALLGGAACHAGRPFYPADIADALASLPRPRGLVTTPFHLKSLLQSGVVLPPVDLVLCATAPLSPQLAAAAEQAMGAKLVEIYGCTEAGQVAARRTVESDVWTTLGELRLQAQDTPDGQQFIVSGGYVTEPTPLADSLELLDQQHFRLLGRTNDMVHVAGKRSSLGHLNFHLNRIAGVDDGAFWLPDAVVEGVVRPIAFVVAPRLSARQIISALRQQLDPAFVPRRVVQVAALPREATGKLTSQALRRFALETLATLAPADRGEAG